MAVARLRRQGAGAANRAASLAPDLARTHTVLGFAELTRVRTSAGEGGLRARDCARVQAIRSPTSVSAWRRSATATCTAAATTSRPRRRSTWRTRSSAAISARPTSRKSARVWRASSSSLAKQLDPHDPTPYFYDAIRKQTINRPVEALHDLQRSIELNDNRAVYRSRFLLDADLAARGASLGRIYRDLGFEQLALVEGWKSLAVDPSDFSAHRLLADTYLGLPRHTIARDSELLQSQLLQPLNISPVQPRLADNGFSFLDTGIGGAGFNEFTRLFAGNQIRFVGDGLIGDHATRADNLILSGIYNRLSYSVGQFHTDTDGIRDNNDAGENVYNAFLQAEISPATSAQIEFRATDSELGDRRMLFDPTNFLPGLRSTGDTTSVRLGGRHTFAPGSILIGSYVHRTLERRSRHGCWAQGADGRGR